jgi:hypothetical protein
MAGSAHANSTAIKLLASFDLTWEDVNRHPGSLLHSLMDSINTPDATGIELNLNKMLSNTQLRTFTNAPAFTQALYR